jgi:uroporphyrinogen-III synthase
MPLHNKKILICRPPDKCRELLAALAERQAQGVVFATSTLEILPCNAALRDALEQLATYDWVVFASPYGVEAFCHFADSLSLPAPDVLGCALGVVGDKTAAAVSVKFQGWSVRQRADNLQTLLDNIASGAPGKMVRALNPTSRDSLDKIPVQLAKNLTLERLPLYLSKPATGHTPEELGRIRQERWDAIVFGSPSCYDSFVAAVGSDCLRNATLATLGATTQKYIIAQGFSVTIVAKRPTVAELLTALEILL